MAYENPTSQSLFFGKRSERDRLRSESEASRNRQRKQNLKDADDAIEKVYAERDHSFQQLNDSILEFIQNFDARKQAAIDAGESMCLVSETTDIYFSTEIAYSYPELARRESMRPIVDAPKMTTADIERLRAYRRLARIARSKGLSLTIPAEFEETTLSTGEKHHHYNRYQIVLSWN